jgi:HPr Serine kinase C-terminal domain
MTLTFNRQTLPFRTDFLIAGTQCLLATNSHEILQAAAHWRSPANHAAVSSFEMEVIVDPDMDGNSEQPAHFRGNRHLVFGILPPRSFVAYDLLRRRVHAVLSPAAASDRSFWNKLLLPITIGVLGTTIGVVPLHCACLHRHGNGVLVAGVSGAGKSTLATALAHRGFAFISDDWAYVSKTNSGLLAHGLSFPIKLLPDAERFFPELRALTPKSTLNGEVAYELDPTQSSAFDVKMSTHPRNIFFLERVSAGGCRMIPCRAEFVRDFFEQNAERLPDELPEAKALRSNVIQLLSACRSWILRTSENPQRTAAALDAFLLEVNRATA